MTTNDTTGTSRLKALAIISALAFALLGSIAIITQHQRQQPTAYAQQQQQSQTFIAKLTGKDEVPPVDTPATGMAQFQLSSDGKEINYDLTAANSNGFMMANIHKGKTGEIRQPVIASLLMGKGKITSSDLQGPLTGKQISDLVDLMKNGGAYVNVHTQQHQIGEIRGQIMSGSSGTSSTTASGTLTVKQVIVSTDKLLPNSKFRITPNPYTLRASLIVQDNNETIDSDLTNGVIVLKNVKFSPYLINETSSAGFGPVLLKTRITVHKTAPNPVVMIENRQLNMPFKGVAKVTAPFLNDSSLHTFVANGASLGGGAIPIMKVDQLPSGFIISTEKHPPSSVLANTTTNAITFKTRIPSTATASQIYNSFKIPTYPAPVKDIAARVTYISPAFVINQQGSGNNSFILTPIIAKIFPDMSLLLNHSSQVASGLARIEDVNMKFAQNANDVGFVFGISDNIPDGFRLPKVPIDTLAFFMNVGYVGAAGQAKAINFSNPISFASSPEVTIRVNKSLNITKLTDTCPDIRLFTFNDSTAKWQQDDVGKPIRAAMLDINNECGYILQTEHFSKFAVGGVKPPPTE